MAECTRPLDSPARFALVKLYKVKQGGQGEWRFFIACGCSRRCGKVASNGPLRCFVEDPERLAMPGFIDRPESCTGDIGNLAQGRRSRPRQPHCWSGGWFL